VVLPLARRAARRIVAARRAVDVVPPRAVVASASGDTVVGVWGALLGLALREHGG
jgi:hypothetical protein